MKIYKVGYKSGVKVSRMDTSVGRSQQSYWSYGFKAFTAEQQPDSLKGKGFNERVFVIKCSPGNPDYDIIEIINNAGDEKYKSLFNELLEIRKLLLIYRLLHHNDLIADISLNIKNRDKQLCKLLIRLFQGTKSINDILNSLSKLLMEKKERKGNTLEARLYHIINDFINANKGGSLLDDDKVTLESSRIWNIVKEELEGEEILGKPRSYDTGEYGVISSTKVVCILEDRFGADKKRNEKIRTLTFSRNKLEKLSRNYSFIDRIKIEAPKTTTTCHAQNDSTCHAQNDMSDMLDSNMSRSNDILPSTKGFSCNYCTYEVDKEADFNHHTTTKHPNQPGYPDRNGRT